MCPRPLTFENVTFSYDQNTAPLLSRACFAFPAGWTGIVGANGAGKTTVLKLATGLLRPDAGAIRIPGRTVYCEQRTDEPPRELPTFLKSADGQALELRSRLNLQAEWYEKWGVLSHGERKRAQIAVALWMQPDVLALDEPTNHIDRDARRQLCEALGRYRGIGLIVSHDRVLLDSLCRQCLFVSRDRTVLRPGSYAAGRAEADREEAFLRRQRDLAKEKCLRLKKSVNRARDHAGRSGRKATKRGLDSRDRDARSKVDAARVTGRDAAVARRAKQLERRLDRETAKLETLSVGRRYALGVWTAGERSRRDTLFRIPGGRILLGVSRCLVYPDLTMRPTDRIALTGPNGAGKTSLIRVIVERLNVPLEQLVYLPQEIDAFSSSQTIRQVRGLSRDRLGLVMSLVRRLGSDPDRLMETVEPSPGEMRKVLLALGLAASPQLIIMDEPTNHLDLPSIECMETALADCSCGLLLVSHDEKFLKSLTSREWVIQPDSGERDRMVLRVK